MKKSLLLTIVLCILSSNIFADITIGILAKRGSKTCLMKWGALGKYLGDKIGENIKILPLKFKGIEPAVKSERIDFLLANSSFYVQMEKKFGIKAIATMINSKKGKALKEFGGVIITKKDSSIKTIADIKGKKFMCVKYSSFGGAQMAWRLLLENGIDPKKDTAAFLEGKKHDNVVKAVKNGSVDVGTIRTDTLERMQDEGTIKLSEFKIINKIADDFPFVHSTILYPEWPMATLKKTDPTKVEKIKKALIGMSKDSNAAKAAKITGWTAALDYTPVKKCLQTIKYGEFK